MKRFEYKWENRGSSGKDLTMEGWNTEHTKIIEWMNGLGDDGWELIDILVNEFGIRLILKREIV